MKILEFGDTGKRKNYSDTRISVSLASVEQIHRIL